VCATCINLTSDELLKVGTKARIINSGIWLAARCSSIEYDWAISMFPNVHEILVQLWQPFYLYNWTFVFSSLNFSPQSTGDLVTFVSGLRYSKKKSKWWRNSISKSSAVASVITCAVRASLPSGSVFSIATGKTRERTSSDCFDIRSSNCPDGESHASRKSASRIWNRQGTSLFSPPRSISSHPRPSLRGACARLAEDFQ
jgi:hypothetical protein